MFAEWSQRTLNLENGHENHIFIRVGNHPWVDVLQASYKALRVSKILRSGTVFVNTYLETAPYFPLGGLQQSRIGRENDLEGLLEYTEVKPTFVKFGPRILVLPHAVAH
jgi:betaine-aldehyde dehydrogenase